jgi:transposase-like protein
MARTGLSVDPEFVATVAHVALGEKVNISRFCREHGVSRGVTGVFHKYVTRFRAEGIDGFPAVRTASSTTSARIPPRQARHHVNWMRTARRGANPATTQVRPTRALRAADGRPVESAR